MRAHIKEANSRRPDKEEQHLKIKKNGQALASGGTKAAELSKTRHGDVRYHIKDRIHCNTGDEK